MALLRFRALRALLALLLCELDRPDEAIEHYERLAVENFTGRPLNPAWIHAMPACAGVCASMGDRARAPVLFHLLEPYASQLALTAGGALGAVAHYLAIQATTLGDFDEAERRFADAGATHERIGAPTWLARTRLEWAGCSSTAPSPGTRREPASSSARPWRRPGHWASQTSSGGRSNSSKSSE